MKKNMGTIDTFIRLFLALFVAVLYYTHVINGATAFILAGIAIVFLLTVSIGFCPLYVPFKINTNKK